MFLHILIGTLVLNFCAGDSVNEAVSSISFHRDDVPLSFKYSAIHVYSTPKPENSHSKPNIYKNIQYAPLVPETREKPAGLYTEAIFSKDHRTESLSNNKFLEPQEHSSSNTNNNRQFVAGYNIETPKFNYAGHKADEKPELVLPINPHGIFSNQYNELSQSNNLQNIVNVKQQSENPFKYIQVLSMMESPKIQPVLNPIVKEPHLHLNVARSYNFARQLPKAPVNEYQKIIRNHQYRIMNDDNLIRNTLLHPVNKHI